MDAGRLATMLVPRGVSSPKRCGARERGRRKRTEREGKPSCAASETCSDADGGTGSPIAATLTAELAAQSESKVFEVCSHPPGLYDELSPLSLSLSTKQDRSQHACSDQQPSPRSQGAPVTPQEASEQRDSGRPREPRTPPMCWKRH